MPTSKETAELLEWARNVFGVAAQLATALAADEREMQKAVDAVEYRLAGDSLTSDAASRATELAAEHPAYIAAAWLGHSTVVAQKHYWQVTDADFERAVAGPEKTARKTAHLRRKERRSRDARGIVTIRSTRRQRLTTNWITRVAMLRRETPRKKWRKCMGIEPTGRMVNMQPSGFEDRGHHQVCRHFQQRAESSSPRTVHKAGRRKCPHSTRRSTS